MKQAMKLGMALTGERVGAVVIFKPGVTVDEARRALINVPQVESGDDPLVDGPQVEAFDPNHGFPVFYVP
jgi:hypothetical protein